MLPLSSIFQRHGVSFHCFADDTQVYLPLRKRDKRIITSLLNYLHEVKLWMSANVLNLNKSKTEVIWFRNSETQVLSDLGNLAPFRKSVVKNLGVQFDASLKFDKQISLI